MFTQITIDERGEAHTYTHTRLYVFFSFVFCFFECSAAALAGSGGRSACETLSSTSRRISLRPLYMSQLDVEVLFSFPPRFVHSGGTWLAEGERDWRQKLCQSVPRNKGPGAVRIFECQLAPAVYLHIRSIDLYVYQNNIPTGHNVSLEINISLIPGRQGLSASWNRLIPTTEERHAPARRRPQDWCWDFAHPCNRCNCENSSDLPQGTDKTYGGL